MSNYTLIPGNNVEVLSDMPEAWVDLTLTSPPYDNARNYNGYSFPFEPLAHELYRVTKPGGVVVWVVGDSTVNGSETLTSYRQALYFKEIGFNVVDTMIFRKANPIPGDCGPRYRQAFEYIYCFGKGKPKTFNPITVPTKSKGKVEYFRVEKTGRESYADSGRVHKAERRVDNIFTYTVGSSSASDKFASKHPAIFPEALALDQIKTWTNPGDLVLDCFCGSGTTGKMAVTTGRDFWGVDISQEYLDEIARPRIEAALAEVNHD